MLLQIPQSIRDKISTSKSLTLTDFVSASGGCINNGGRLVTSSGSFFLKWNDAEKFPGMFEAECKGLSLLAETDTIRIPKIDAVGIVEKDQYVLMEYIDQGSQDKNFWRTLGEQLSGLHKKSSPFFGLGFDNFIGSLPQQNSAHTDWLSFFIEQRLKPQITLAENQNRLSKSTLRKLENLCLKLPDLLVEENPSLLHGDLWSGNLLCDNLGKPVLIDPAVYYGNREAELAFTYLFGGFGKEFYDSYNSCFPLEKGFQSRIDLYNLYPLLVHVNLFGGGYENQVVSILGQFV